MNEKQKEGLATVLDNLATSAIIGFMVAVFDSPKITNYWLLSLPLVAVLCLIAAFVLRRN